MDNNETYISYVIQSSGQHTHHFDIVKLPDLRTAPYADNTSQEVIKWSLEKQKALSVTDKLVILNYFNISNLN